MSGRPLVMGILNVTPDSFSDGGQYLDAGAAIAHGRQMVAEGAAVVDVGGESTRPGATPVDEATETARVLPVVEALADEVRVSIDTTKPGVARAAVRAGATLVNDVGGGLWPVAADLGVGWVAMHMQGTPATMQLEPRYDDVVAEVRDHLAAAAARARAAGVTEVWIDPGIGFGKTAAHNVALLAALDELVGLGHPVLVGTSRKRFLGDLTADSDRAARARLARVVWAGAPAGTAPPTAPAVGPTAPDDRLEATIATVTWALTKGARMVRVHDVRAAVCTALVVGP
jgi:dihydropteroate synthase